MSIDFHQFENCCWFSGSMGQLLTTNRKEVFGTQMKYLYVFHLQILPITSTCNRFRTNKSLNQDKINYSYLFTHISVTTIKVTALIHFDSFNLSSLCSLVKSSKLFCKYLCCSFVADVVLVVVVGVRQRCSCFSIMHYEINFIENTRSVQMRSKSCIKVDQANGKQRSIIDYYQFISLLTNCFNFFDLLYYPPFINNEF